MAKGNKIVISSPPRGIQKEGIIGDTSVPGTFMQIQAGTAPTGGGGGEHTWIAAATGTDGKDAVMAVLQEDNLQGFPISTAYVAGRKGKLYFPVHGDELNLVVGEVAGTGNTFAIGDRFILDAETGLLVPESGSPQATIAVALEAKTQIAGGTLLWCMFM